MLKFYYNGAPNPTKVALFLEEAGIAYAPIPVDTRKGEQHKPAYLAVNPNAKVPAIVDGDVTMFDSNAILLYLAEKTGKFLPPKGDKERGELLSWLLFVATSAFSTDDLPAAAIWWPRPTRSSTWPRGAGRDSFPPSSAKAPGRSFPISSGSSTRSARGRRRSGRWR
jgi:glutathione S-transferase